MVYQLYDDSSLVAILKYLPLHFDFLKCLGAFVAARVMKIEISGKNDVLDFFEINEIHYGEAFLLSLLFVSVFIIKGPK